MFDVVVDIDEPQELSDWCDFNLDGYVTHGTGHKFYFEDQTTAKAFKEIAALEEWN